MQGWPFMCDSRIVRPLRPEARPLHEAAPPRWMESDCLSACDEKSGVTSQHTSLCPSPEQQGEGSSHLLLHRCHSCNPRVDLKKAVGRCVETCSRDLALW